MIVTGVFALADDSLHDTLGAWRVRSGTSVPSTIVGIAVALSGRNELCFGF
jgi:hypothetical protein